MLALYKLILRSCVAGGKCPCDIWVLVPEKFIVGMKKTRNNYKMGMFPITPAKLQMLVDLFGQSLRCLIYFLTSRVMLSVSC